VHISQGHYIFYRDNYIRKQAIRQSDDCGHQVRFPWSFSFVDADKDWIFSLIWEQQEGGDNSKTSLLFCYFCNEISACSFLKNDFWWEKRQKMGLLTKILKGPIWSFSCFLLLITIAYGRCYMIQYIQCIHLQTSSPLNVTTDIFLVIQIFEWTLHQKYLWKPWECHNLQPDHS